MSTQQSQKNQTEKKLVRTNNENSKVNMSPGKCPSSNDGHKGMCAGKERTQSNWKAKNAINALNKFMIEDKYFPEN